VYTKDEPAGDQRGFPLLLEPLELFPPPPLLLDDEEQGEEEYEDER